MHTPQKDLDYTKTKRSPQRIKVLFKCSGQQKQVSLPKQNARFSSAVNWYNKSEKSEFIKHVSLLKEKVNVANLARNTHISNLDYILVMI